MCGRKRFGRGAWTASAGLRANNCTFTAARLRSADSTRRCESCGSYNTVAGGCQHCGWIDGSYQPPMFTEISDEEIAPRLEEPCIPSSDISTFLGPEDF